MLCNLMTGKSKNWLLKST